MGIFFRIDNEEKYTLTTQTIDKLNKRFDILEGENEYLSQHVTGIEIFGKMDVYDKSKEILCVQELSMWSKKVSHEAGAYREIKIQVSDGTGTVYDTIEIKKAFIVQYKESLHAKDNIGTFYVFLRSLEGVEQVIGK